MEATTPLNQETRADGKGDLSLIDDLFTETFQCWRGICNAGVYQVKQGRRLTAAEAQIELLIELLRSGPKDTHCLRRMGISHPAGRVQDLINRGFVIDSARVTTVDSDGFTHSNVALYSLVVEPESEAA